MSFNGRGIGRVPRERIFQATRPKKIDLFSIAGVLGQVALIGLVVVTPWLFGGVQAAVQVWLFVGAMVALGCWFVRQLVDSRAASVLPLAALPLIGAVGLGVLQMVPLDPGVSALLSPGGAQLRSSFQAEGSVWKTSPEKDLGVVAMAERQPLSLCPAATRRDLALLVLGVGVFLSGAVFFGTPRAQMWFCGLIAVNGATLAFFGLIQKLSWNGLLYWSVPLTRGGGPFGPFVNQNNSGGFLCLCLAGAVGIAIWAVHRGSPNDPSTQIVQLPEDHKWLARPKQRLIESLAHLNAGTLTAVSLAACIVGGILCSLSRGAGVAMIGATIVSALAVLAARRRKLRVWSMGVVVMVGLALVGWAGMRESVYARFATLFNQETMSEHGLLSHWPAGLKAAANFWQSGSGLGTYRYVYGLHQHELDESWFPHAENNYLEVLVDGGIPGLGLMLTTIALVGIAAWRLLRDDSDVRLTAFGIAGVFALTGQVIAGFFDFGIYIPANMLLLALFCGAVSGGAARQVKRKKTSAARSVLTRYLSLATLLVAMCFVANLWGLLEIRRVKAVETAVGSADFTETWEGTLSLALPEDIERLAAAAGCREDDVDAQYGLARLWISLYRVRALEQLRDEEPPETKNGYALWLATSPTVVHGRAHEFAQNHLWPELEQLRGEPVIMDHLREALRHLILARRSCPLISEVHLGIAELWGLVASPADDQSHLERARRLAPGVPDLLFQCGLLELQAGRPELAYQSWRKGLSLRPRHLDNILALVGEDLAAPGVIEKVLPDSPSLLVQLTQEEYAGDEHAHVRRLLLHRAEELVEQIDLPEDERCYLRGSILVLKEVYPKAIKNYSRAVELRPQEIVWRYELAILLQQQGRLDEAHQQAQWCARMAPRQRRYRNLLEQIHETKLRQ